MTLEQYIQNLNLAICTEFTSDLVPTCIPDLNHKSIDEFAKKISLDYVERKENGNVCFANDNYELRDDFKQVFSTVDFLDYIYAVSFSADYKEKFQKTFSIDFSKIPFPRVSNDFWILVKLGKQLRELHLLKVGFLETSTAIFSIDGDNVVTKIKFKIIDITLPAEGNSIDWNCFEGNSRNEKNGIKGKVFINDNQYFTNIPESVWNLSIGNSQPAQKWLLDRNGQKLESNDIKQYQKIITTLIEVNRIVKEINKIEIQ